MHLIRGLLSLKRVGRPHAVTIGNFDGVHLGHQAVFRALATQADMLGLPTLVILFEPQPMEYFMPDEAPPRLTRLRDKLTVLRTLNIDTVCCLHFDDALAQMPARSFIDEVILGSARTGFLMVGDDFRFGQARRGDFELLKQTGREHGFAVERMPSFEVAGERVSSTRVREALANGDFVLAHSLLGRPFSLSGRVIHGDKRGRDLGFPTANIVMERRRTPLFGVYAVEIAGLSDALVSGVANLGTRPTVDGLRTLLETHLFDCDEDLYGRLIEVRFVKKLRDEMRFTSTDKLKAQIKQDIAGAKRFFSARSV